MLPTKQDFRREEYDGVEVKTSKVEDEEENGVAELPGQDMNRMLRQHQN